MWIKRIKKETLLLLQINSWWTRFLWVVTGAVCVCLRTPFWSVMWIKNKKKPKHVYSYCEIISSVNTVSLSNNWNKFPISKLKVYTSYILFKSRNIHRRVGWTAIFSWSQHYLKDTWTREKECNVKTKAIMNRQLRNFSAISLVGKSFIRWWWYT